jgi:stringent starvation protein B
MSVDKLPSTKPYLVRAIWEWCNDNGFTPYLAVAVDASCRVPQEFVKDGQIVLNIGAEATHKLQMQNDLVSFQARFGGVAREIHVPMSRVAAIYAHENGNGTAFEVEATGRPLTAPDAADGTLGDDHLPPPSSSPAAGGRARLQRVK